MTSEKLEAKVGWWVEYDDNGRRFGIVYAIAGRWVSLADALGRALRRNVDEISPHRPARVCEINRTLGYAREYRRGKKTVAGLISARKTRQAERRAS
jgi:hypothetical protein